MSEADLPRGFDGLGNSGSDVVERLPANAARPPQLNLCRRCLQCELDDALSKGCQRDCRAVRRAPLASHRHVYIHRCPLRLVIRSKSRREVAEEELRLDGEAGVPPILEWRNWVTDTVVEDRWDEVCDRNWDVRLPRCRLRRRGDIDHVDGLGDA